MAYYKDLREHLSALEQRGKLLRIERPINKDTQLQPLVRLQFRGLPEEQRKAFLFTNVFDSRGKQYSTPVAMGALAGSSEIYSIGLMCPREEISARLTQAELNPIEPKLVDGGPVQEEVYLGDGLLEHGGLDEFPVPIATPGFDVAPYLSSSAWVTKDPDTGIPNVAVHRGQLKSPTRIGIHFGDITRHALIHWRKCKQKGKPLEVAIVTGGPPSIGYVAVSNIPVGVSEFTVAGGIAGEPLEMVKCKTVDIEVPAHAEVVIEGELTTEELEMEAPFGEGVGFMGMTEMMPYLTVKCITHRKNPIWLAFISQFPPSEGSKILQHASEGALFKHLRHDLNMEHVSAVAFHESNISEMMIVLKVKKTGQDTVWKTLEAAGERYPVGKIIIAVDEDIDPWDADAVNWAMGFRMQPHRDCRIVTFQAAELNDPSLEPLDALIERRHATHPERPEASRILVNATLKWDYPPLSLPKQQFMEEALRIWQEEGLPQLKLKEPWWGYSLGYWGDEYDEWADRAVKGDYYQTGEERARNRRKI